MANESNQVMHIRAARLLARLSAIETDRDELEQIRRSLDDCAARYPDAVRVVAADRGWVLEDVKIGLPVAKDYTEGH